MTFFEETQICKNKRCNHLAGEKSPYLLQHVHNPVDWYPWGEEAFEKAKREDKPIFLSIGYSTCHWCHVMQRESFEDEEVAALLNENFVSIKVDREERPDIDQIYMTACQMLTGGGGWPLTVFLDHEKRPFYAGTYFPKEDKNGIIGFMSLLLAISNLWQNSRARITAQSANLTTLINSNMQKTPGSIDQRAPEDAFLHFKAIFDKRYGGFGSAPKFPSPHNLMFLLRYWSVTGEKSALEMAVKTLDGMYRGGIYDHIGYGFCRYSTDEKWLAPHFEKMLYDNALISMALLEAYKAAGNTIFANVARNVFEYVMRDMTAPEGGFYSAQDADSDGVEGAFYLWTREEIEQVLGREDAEVFCEYYGITREGNFEGKNIPNLIHSQIPQGALPFIEDCRKKLYWAREKRVKPFRDDKILTSWNGLMIASMAMGARVLNDKSLYNAAEKAAEFLLENMVDKRTGRLFARYRSGEAAIPAYADCYANLVWGLIELYRAGFKGEYLERALMLTDGMISLFWDKKEGGLFMTGNDSEALLSRPKEGYDGAMPSANSVAASNMLRLSGITGRGDLQARAEEIFNLFGSEVTAFPSSYTHMLSAYLNYKMGTDKVILAGQLENPLTSKMLETAQKGYRPFALDILLTGGEADDRLKKLIPYARDIKVDKNAARAYVCKGFVCQPPVDSPEALNMLLQ